jgi:citrate synthase
LENPTALVRFSHTASWHSALQVAPRARLPAAHPSISARFEKNRHLHPFVFSQSDSFARSFLLSLNSWLFSRASFLGFIGFFGLFLSFLELAYTLPS